jgi:chromosome segregation ATPase
MSENNASSSDSEKSDGLKVPGDVHELAAMFAQSEPEAESEGVVEEIQENEESEASSDAEENDLSQTETEEEVAEATEEESAEEEADSEEGEQSPAEFEYAKFRKRVDKLTAEKHELREQMEELRSQMREMRDQKQAEPERVQTVEERIESISTPEEWRAEYDRANDAIEWADANEDGVTVKNDDGSEHLFDSDDVRNIRRAAERVLRRDLPKRAEVIQKRVEFDQAAAAEFAWMQDNASQEFQEAQAIREAFPELKRLPEMNMVVGDLIEGRKARRARQGKGKAKAAPRQKLAPAQPSKSSAPAPVSKKAVSEQDAMSNLFNGGGSREDLTALFKTLV